jgi:phosphoserine phosphatase
MSEFAYRLVSFDIDGTLTAGHGWRFLAEKLGRLDEFEATDADYHAHRQSEDDHLRRLLAIARGIPLERVEAVLEVTPKIDGIAETVSALKERGAVPVLLSHNPRYVCAWYARRFGFLGWDGMDDGGTPEVAHGIVQEPGRVRTGKVAGLGRLLGRFGVPAGSAAHLGDGWADAELFPLVGLGIALNSRLAEVNRAADVALQLRDLREVLPVLDRTPPKDPRRRPYKESYS